MSAIVSTVPGRKDRSRNDCVYLFFRCGPKVGIVINSPNVFQRNFEFLIYCSWHQECLFVCLFF